MSEELKQVTHIDNVRLGEDEKKCGHHRSNSAPQPDRLPDPPHPGGDV